MQATLRKTANFTGVGLHSGRLTRVAILPQAANVGIWFRRTDLDDAELLLVGLHVDGLEDGQDADPHA